MRHQETLEEAIKQELENHFFSNISEIKQAEYFINFGAKWQQKQDKNKYSDEEVYDILIHHTVELFKKERITLEQFWNKFKKK